MVKPFKADGKKTYNFQVMVNGERIIESTGETNFNKAQKVANKRALELREGTDYRIQLTRLIRSIKDMPEKAREKAINDCTKSLLSENPVKMEIKSGLSLFLEKPGKAPDARNTLNSFKRVWTALCNWLAEYHPDIKYVHEINEEIAENFLNHIWNTGIAEQTYNEYIKILRRIFNVLSKDIGTSQNVWNSTEKVKINSVSKKPLTKDEFVSIMQAAEGEIRLLLIIGFYTGLRLGDACQLKWEDVNLKTAMFNITPSKTKGHDKTINIPIHSILYEILRRVPSTDSEYVLPEIAATYLKDPGAVSKKIQKTFIKAGIKTTEERKRGVKNATVYGFHSLRHSFISLCAAEGIPQHVVREMVGHSSDAIHQIYQHANTEQKRKAIDMLPSIEEENIEKHE